jgi:protein TonB
MNLCSDEIAAHDAARHRELLALVLSVAFNLCALSLVAAWSGKPPSPVMNEPVEITRVVAPVDQPKDSEAKEILPPAAEPPPEPKPPANVPQPLPNVVKKPKLPKPATSAKVAHPPPPTRVEAPIAQGSPPEQGANVVPSVEAVPIEEVRPEIPDELRTQQYTSNVRVKVDVTADGTAVPVLKTSSGNPEIDKRVLAALRKWRWRPALLDGRPMESTRYFRFEFEVR